MAERLRLEKRRYEETRTQALAVEVGTHRAIARAMGEDVEDLPTWEERKSETGVPKAEWITEFDKANPTPGQT